MADLDYYKEKYSAALMAYSDRRNDFDLWNEQFNGSLKLKKGKDAESNYNFTRELIEAQIDSNLPPPLVTPKKPTPRNRELADVITSMIRNELDRLPFEEMNDLDERVTRVMGGNAFMVEWDNAAKSHNTVGAVDVRLVSPMCIIPQEKVYDVRKMDYLFMTFEDTKTRIKARYGKDVRDEAVDSQTGEQGTSSDRVTQVICFFRNSKGGIGCVSWSGDTKLVNEDNYFARKDKVCAKCGKPQGGKVCACGSSQWVRRDRDFETIADDIIRKDGIIIPAYSPVRSESGELVFEDYEEPAVDDYTGLPIYNRTFDDMGMAIGEEPATVTKQRMAYEPTKLPYYQLNDFPISIRKNISAYQQFLGDSDCEAVREHQLQANKAITKIDQKIASSAYVITKPAELNFTVENSEIKVLNIKSAQQIGMIRSIPLEFNTTAEYMVIERAYQMAKSILGVTDSFQGKPDNTAQSGRAKEAQIAQAAGIQKSKRVMKNAAYATLYELMFKFMLAYADEPRTYASTDDDGQPTEKVFNRYDFLEQDEYGKWFYNDEFLFSVDENGAMQRDKNFMLEDIRTDFRMGAYGDPQEPETMVTYFREKAMAGYSGAKRLEKYWQKKVEQRNEAQLIPPVTPQEGGITNELPKL